MGVGLGVRLDVNEEMKFCENSKEKNIWGSRGGSGWGVRVDVKEELKFLGKKWGGGRVLGGGVGLGRCQGGCERRIEVFGKIRKKNPGGGRDGVRWGGGGVGQGGCERKIEVFVKIQKKKYFFFGGGGGVGSGVGLGGRVGARVDVNEELKFWGKLTKKIGEGVRLGGGQVGGGQGGCERNVGGRG